MSSLQGGNTDAINIGELITLPRLNTRPSWVLKHLEHRERLLRTQQGREKPRKSIIPIIESLLGHVISTLMKKNVI